ncbi:hypothetical protein HOY82DRAFT_545087 [Tuber indicum]|nr:hypothetical protein HOY82DRAFT_545087 [Tuber indicum]
MPGAAHGITSRSFMMELAVKISSIPGHQKHSSILLGRSRFSVPGKRSKEGDEGIKPTATRRSRDDWPSLVVEVGYPQSLPSLRADARWRLDHSGERTNMVIVIQIKDLGPKWIYLECWERFPDPNKASTRSHTQTIPDFEQYFDIDASGTVVSYHPSHPDLVIPYKAMFDNPHPTGTDIIISKAELSQWVLHVFGGLH